MSLPAETWRGLSPLRGGCRRRHVRPSRRQAGSQQTRKKAENADGSDRTHVGSDPYTNHRPRLIPPWPPPQRLAIPRVDRGVPPDRDGGGDRLSQEPQAGSERQGFADRRRHDTRRTRPHWHTGTTGQFLRTGRQATEFFKPPPLARPSTAYKAGRLLVNSKNERAKARAIDKHMVLIRKRDTR